MTEHRLGLGRRARLLGTPVARGRMLAWYFVGELGKYLPGGVWPVLGRGELARRGGVAPARAYASVALSLVTLYLAAMLVAVGLLPFSLGGRWSGADGPAAAPPAPVGLGALHPKVLGPVLDLVRRSPSAPSPSTSRRGGAPWPPSCATSRRGC